MCVVSMVGDDWTRKMPGIWPQSIPFPESNPPKKIDIDELIRQRDKDKAPVTRKEFDELKRQMEKMREELEDARKQDLENNEPDCEMEDKVSLLKLVAEALGVDLNGVFPDDNNKTTSAGSPNLSAATAPGFLAASTGGSILRNDTVGYTVNAQGHIQG